MQVAWCAALRRRSKPDGVLIHSAVDRHVLDLRGYLPDWYHTTWHSQSDIADKLASLFDTATYFVVADGIPDCLVASGSVDSAIRGAGQAREAPGPSPADCAAPPPTGDNGAMRQ